MDRILFITGNKHKIEEARKILPEYTIDSLKDIGFNGDIPETGISFEENAIQKVEYLAKDLDYDIYFAEDSGLVVDALNGEPGIYSSRYSGENATDSRNIELLLNKLEKKDNRAAKFIATIALKLDDQIHIFVGEVDGKIAHKPMGENGFGYDPVFIPLGYNKSFAQLGSKIKDKISHRKNAMDKLQKFLKV